MYYLYIIEHKSIYEGATLKDTYTTSSGKVSMHFTTEDGEDIRVRNLIDLDNDIYKGNLPTLDLAGTPVILSKNKDAFKEYCINLLENEYENKIKQLEIDKKEYINSINNIKG
jgi:hypothetical protein